MPKFGALVIGRGFGIVDEVESFALQRTVYD